MSGFRGFLSRYSTALALVAMAAALACSTDTFLTVSNLLNVLRQISINLCLSIGMTLVILCGGIDLSVGSVLALAGAVAAGLLKHGFVLPGGTIAVTVTVSGSVLVALAVGGACGGVNGLAITRFGLPPFVATLGMLSIARGLTLLWTGGFPINDLGPRFGLLGTGRVAGIPMPVWISGLLALAFFGVTRRTRWGRRLYAVGGNARAAALSGVNVARVQAAAYVVAGALAGVAGVLTAARLDSATPSAGVGYELDSIAAVVIGGTSLSGGRGSVPGTALGCLIIGVLNNGLVLLGVSPFWQQVIKGAVILLAAAFDRRGAEAER